MKKNNVKLFLLGTAREGSTRVRNKMIRPFGNTSLYEILLKKFEKLIESDLFCGVGMAINRNDRTLWEMSENSKVPIIERNDESVRGLTNRSKELHFLKDIDADYIMWVNGCLPFLKTETILEAAKTFIENYPKIKSMTAVKEKYNWYWDYNTKEAINNLDPRNVSTQKSPPLLETVHAFHIFSRTNLLENDSYWNLKENDPYLYIMKDEIECLDIDSEVEFKINEYIWNLICEGRRNSRVIYKELPKEIQEKFKKIKLLVTDFDGVWTDDLVLHSQDGNESVLRCKADSQGVDLLSDIGLYNKENYLDFNHPLDILIISRESNPIVKSVAEKIKIKYIQGKYKKIDSLYNEIEKRGLTLDHVLYIGNDLNDIECMEKVGLSVAVANSPPKLLEIADYVTKTSGGSGAVREVINLLLESRK